jgi:hypothetical protein
MPMRARSSGSPRLRRSALRAPSAAWIARAARIVFVRLRVPEVHEHAVAEQLCDVAVESGHGFHARVLVNCDEHRQLLGVEVLAERRGPDHVAEHGGEQTPLSAGLEVRR